MQLERAREVLTSSALDDPGSFYGPANSLALGVGLIIDGVEYPVFDHARDVFSVRTGLIYVLSHECDLDPNNDRFLNGAALICPILPLKNVVNEATQLGLRDDELGAFLGNVAARRATRCVYMPPIATHLPDGGLLNLNLIASTSINRLNAGARVLAVSNSGHRSIDAAIDHHLRREKSEVLPLANAAVKRSRTIRG